MSVLFMVVAFSGDLIIIFFTSFVFLCCMNYEHDIYNK